MMGVFPDLLSLTKFHAAAAVPAQIGIISRLGPGRNAFRIVAPDALQRASLGEKGGAYPRAVMDGKTLGVKKYTEVFHKSLCNIFRPFDVGILFADIKTV